MSDPLRLERDGGSTTRVHDNGTLSRIEVGIRSLANALHVERTLVALGRRWNRGQHWCRVVMDRRIAEALDRLAPPTKDAVEVSGTAHARRGWRSYTTLSFPEFDLCRPPEEHAQFDVVICEQVLEHVPDPVAAARTLRDLARPGGSVIVSTPFLLRIHPSPQDFWRFTPEGLMTLLRGADLIVDDLRSWGNASCVRSNLRRWRAYRSWHSLRNEPDLPIVVWAVARRPSSSTNAGDAPGSAAR